MKMCKCGSYAINDDKSGVLCDKCLRDLEIATLKANQDELLGALGNFVALYDDDIGMDAFPAATQVELKSTTLDVLRRGRAALARIEGSEG